MTTFRACELTKLIGVANREAQECRLGGISPIGHLAVVNLAVVGSSERLIVQRKKATLNENT